MVGQLHRLHHRADRLGAAGRAESLGPAGFQVLLRELLQQHADFAAGPLPALARELAGGEEALRGGDAADLHAFGVQRRQSAADDEFGTAAADVDHQPRLARRRQIVRDAEKDQAAFLAAGHHFHRMAQRRFRRGKERLRRGEAAHGIGGHRAHAGGGNTGDTLAEAGQAVQRTRAMLGIQRTVGAQASGHAHGFTQAVDHARLAMLHARNDHVKTV